MMQRQTTRTIALGLALTALLTIASVPGRAVTPDEMLQDPALEARARTLSQGLRCVVCQNQSIDDSTRPWRTICGYCCAIA